MIIPTLIRQQVGTMFQFMDCVNRANRYVILRRWTDIHQTEKTHAAYERCVGCNQARTDIDLANPETIKLDAGSYFCTPCLVKIGEIQMKYYALGADVANRFDAECNAYLFKSRK